MMGTIVEQFGKTVSRSIEKSPSQALCLLRAGYFAGGKRIQYLPDRRLLPHQKYAAVVSSRAICAPLAKPERSAVVSVFTPCEPLHAMGVTPQFTEGLACYLKGACTERVFIRYAENAGVPPTYCSYHKILLGAALSGVLPKPRFVVNTTLACDANNSTFRMLADTWQVPHFTLDVPCRRNTGTISYVAEQLHEFTAFLEKTMGKTFPQAALREVIRRENRSLRLYRESFDKLAGKAMPNNMTSEMYKVFFTHVLLGTREAERYFELLLADEQKAAPSRGEIRILWAHSLPFWQDSLKSILNFNPKIQLLCCDLNFDAVVELDEARPCESIACKLLSHTMGGENARRTDRLLDMAKTLRADGVIYFCHWGCKHTLGGADATKHRLEAAGIPTLVLEGDGCDGGNINDGQMSTRLQAFLEILEARK
jgi:benzoyl-CoA reductase/2-hydroxyglutaryl-CoA dehydratase subunit BcrC/BadD/HgdB